MKTLSLSEKKQPLFSDYCQFLLASFDNFTQTYFADHTEKWSHDQLNRLLREERISAGDLWRSVKNDIEFHPDGYLATTTQTERSGLSDPLQMAHF